MRTRTSLYDPGDPQPLTHGIVPDEDALVVFIRNCLRIVVPRGRQVHGLCGRGRGTQLGTTARVNKSCCVPCPPNRSEGVPENRSCELGPQVIVIVRVAHHCKVPGPVDTGDEDRLDVIPVPSLAGERYPRVVMLFHIIFKGARSLNVFPVSLTLGHKGSALSPCKSE